MKKDAAKLIPALGIGTREHIAVVGAGGKSTLLFALAEELREHGCSVVSTTTTKIWLWQRDLAAKSMYLADTAWEETLGKALERYGHVFVSRKPLPSRKTAGISKDLADAIFELPGVDHVIVEADGAAGRPVKVPSEHEPVIPDSATTVIAVMGLEALFARCVEENVFRMEPFRAMTGLEIGSELSPETLTKIFLNPSGLFRGSPGDARRVAFLNKMDLVENHGAARRLARSILASNETRVERVVLGSLKKNTYAVLLGDKS